MMTCANYIYRLPQGFTSAPSDGDGVARFEKLTILGTTAPFVYIAFYCEGVVASWSLGFRY